MPERVEKIKVMVDLERYYVDREDILVQLRIAEEIYILLDRNEITREEALIRLDREVFNNEKLNIILETDDTRYNMSPLAAVRHNIGLGHFFTPKDTQSDQSEAA